MLKLRRGVVVEEGEADSGMQELIVELDGQRRQAIADTAMVGFSAVGDDVIVNTEAVDLALGSGGWDILHVNLTSGLAGQGEDGAHVMKLNYSPLQHAVLPVEGESLAVPLDRPVACFSLHGQLAPLLWALGESAPGTRVGYVQTLGGALPGRLSKTVPALRRRELLHGHLTASDTYGGVDGEAITVAGAIHHGIHDLGWDAAVTGPGPGILGSASALGHGGIHVLDAAHVALALGCSTLVVARMSSGDARPRHQGLSHHTRTVLELLLAPVTVALPEGESLSIDARHDTRHVAVDLDGYRATGLPAQNMGRSIDEDQAFFAASLAAGTALADLVAGSGG